MADIESVTFPSPVYDLLTLQASTPTGYNAVVTFHGDGRVSLGPGLSPDEASQAIVRAIATAWQGPWDPTAVKGLLDRLTPEAYLLAVAGRCRACGAKEDAGKCYCDVDPRD